MSFHRWERQRHSRWSDARGRPPSMCLLYTSSFLVKSRKVPFFLQQTDCSWDPMSMLMTKWIFCITSIKFPKENKFLAEIQHIISSSEMYTSWLKASLVSHTCRCFWVKEQNVMRLSSLLSYRMAVVGPFLILWWSSPKQGLRYGSA